MKRLSSIVCQLGLLGLLLVYGVAHAQGATVGQLTLHMKAAGPRISPTLFGLMFEDINHAGDGGLYAELIQNRAFLDDAATPVHWSTVASGNAQAAIALDTRSPVNTQALTTSLRLTIARVQPGERAGISNEGYGGFPIWPASTYHVSFYARASADFHGPLRVSLESSVGHVFAAATLAGVTTAWHHYTVPLTTPAGIPLAEADSFVISASHTGSVWFSLVSVFPKTWHNQPNGLRVDVMRLLAALHPGFLRFPGGNYLEGQTIATRFNWKKTIGPLSSRPGHLNDAWGYRSTDGLGLLEYLEWADTLHMVPVLAVYAGYSLNGAYVPAGPALAPFVQDALDEIQYATGSIRTRWGARRAADGHPAPFAVPYVEIGNEDFFDKSGSYDARFAQFYDAIKAAYPHIQVIATTDVTSRTPDLYDQHFYESPQWFIDHASYYDSYSRSAPRIMVGEYAAQVGPIAQGIATLGGALGEAAWMTGLERNADVVTMASYAPLFQNLGQFQWSPDLISYDPLLSFGSPSYYVQQLFGANHGDRVVPTSLRNAPALAVVASREASTGALYVTVVNTGASAQLMRLSMDGGTAVSATGSATVLTSGSVDDQNSLISPTLVVPHTYGLVHLSTTFAYRFAANSVTVLRLAAR